MGSGFSRVFTYANCLVVALLLWLGAPGAGADECHPDYDPQLDHYVLGYGSLMNTQSKNRTAPGTGDNIPVVVRGYERRWGLQGPRTGFGTTFLVALPKPGASMNAVVFRLGGSASLRAFDARERAYCRAAVEPGAIAMLTGEPHPPVGRVWIYVDKRAKTAGPSERYPIVQSYVDIFLGGCLELEQRHTLKGFAKRCIASTVGWSRHWVNDRLHPRRAWAHEPNALRIDGLLADTVPEAFAAITIE